MCRRKNGRYGRASPGGVHIGYGNSPSVFLCSRIVMAAVYGRPSGLPGDSTGLAHLCTAATPFEVRAKRCQLLKLE